jgi:hypothetical protein
VEAVEGFLEVAGKAEIQQRLGSERSVEPFEVNVA